MENSKIQWTDNTFNPFWGCTRVSLGCKFCYAETQSARFGNDVWGPTANRKPMSETYWKQPEKWDREAVASGHAIRIFCASMADAFEGPETCQNTEAYKVVQDGRQRLFDLIQRTPHLTWQLLTKRPENIMKMVPESWKEMFPENVWIGTSAENQAAADNRIPLLLKCPAWVHFVSLEPLIGAIELRPEWITKMRLTVGIAPERFDALTAEELAQLNRSVRESASRDGLNTLDWAIIGGESGPNARPMHPEWVYSLRDQCVESGTAFFMKQGSQTADWPKFRDFSLFPQDLQIRQFPDVKR